MIAFSIDLVPWAQGYGHWFISGCSHLGLLSRMLLIREGMDAWNTKNKRSFSVVYYVVWKQFLFLRIFHHLLGVSSSSNVTFTSCHLSAASLLLWANQSIFCQSHARREQKHSLWALNSAVHPHRDAPWEESFGEQVGKESSDKESYTSARQVSWALKRNPTVYSSWWDQFVGPWTFQDSTYKTEWSSEEGQVTQHQELLVKQITCKEMFILWARNSNINSCQFFLPRERQMRGWQKRVFQK